MTTAEIISANDDAQAELAKLIASAAAQCDRAMLSAEKSLRQAASARAELAHLLREQQLRQRITGRAIQAEQRVRVREALSNGKPAARAYPDEQR